MTHLLLVALCGVTVTSGALAEVLQIEVSGIDGEAADNVRAFIGAAWVTPTALRTERRRQKFRRDARQRARAAMRPYGHYFASVDVGLSPAGDEQWKVLVRVDPGPPLKIREQDIRIVGEGAEFTAFIDWRAKWPLLPGQTLHQPTWENQKEALKDLAEEWGYFDARLIEQRIELNLEANTADLFLVMDTGPRSVMGEVTFEQDQVLDIVLQPQPRFQPGDAYSAWYVGRLRTDLWKLGYFDNVAVAEVPRPGSSPPVMDFKVTADARKPTTHQATVGYGTDSELRLQYRWTWHRMSERGDMFTVAGGYQQRDDEFLVSSEYRLPRQNGKKQYWLVNGLARSERERFEITEGPSNRPVLTASGRINDYAIRVGRGQFREVAQSNERLIESLFVEYLHEDSSFDLRLPGDVPLPEDTRDSIDESLDADQDNLMVGMDWNWPVIHGNGFQTTGHNERAWIFHSNEGWGSDRTFTQAYASSRWNILLAERWMLLVRGELGYSDAPVDDFSFDLPDGAVDLTITQLPYLYRFKAGGSRSVRGYGFEELSDSGLGANHLFTASIEGEYNFRENWSAAAFMDIGNAFNSWGDMGLKRGVGVGLRWYTIAGAIRLDFATALDREGEPWSIHLTIGTPLL